MWKNSFWSRGLQVLVASTLAAALGAVMTACPDGMFEDAGEAVDDAGEKVKDKGEEVKDKIDDAGYAPPPRVELPA